MDNNGLTFLITIEYTQTSEEYQKLLENFCGKKYDEISQEEKRDYFDQTLDDFSEYGLEDWYFHFGDTDVAFELFEN